jgi:SAM-dependent methyltransferase
MDLRDLRDTWNELGHRDAMWAVLTGPLEGRRVWDREAFFRTGVEEVGAVLARAAALGAPPRTGRALDFGCGIGRLSQALAGHFQQVDGVDIARSMLEQAREQNRAGDRVRYHLNEDDSLALFPDASFDFIYSSITLQHMEPRYSRRFLMEFFRVAAPGGVVVFQIPSEPVPAPPRQASASGPLPNAAFRAQIDAPASLTCAPGARVRLPVRVKNVSPVPWPAIGDPDGQLSVRLANHWRHRFGWMVRQDDVRAALPDDLAPGEEITLDLLFDAPASGTHILELDMVQESVRWFAEAGSPTARVRVVVDGTLAPNAVVGIPRRMEMYGIPRPDVDALIVASHATLLAADDDDAPGEGWTSYRYFTRRL